ncbi:putative polyketide synthase [Parathielavia hyrcaniae]|uniref:Polyketide synthase n=1 Tax=Parathielavia hyrcaniae TaxID=113614 RepID=A0AAN6SWB7_9PEZI|nr:putative polyketide synthase [Parathielavia hyrcaniae]
MVGPEPIAIIGTGCRFPGGVSSPSGLWSLLKNPPDLSQRVPHDRFNGDAFYHPDGKHHGTTNVQQAYFLSEGIRSFDASFFNISAREAEGIDPQQRLVLETVYEAVERAGLRPSALKGSSTGVFCGVMCDDYWQILARDVEQLPQYTSTGVARNNVSNRVSYFFDWHGPSMTVDTACSSSLVAVHLAVQAIREGSCRVAVASGTNLISSPYFFMAASRLNMLSPTGRSRMWDVDADGYARGEGVASVVLKRLSDAIADGDPIECIIRETGVNQDGRTMGITMPSSAAQAELIRSTYAKAGLCLDRPEDRCQYFEAHGTGTQAGDPQEAGAIAGAFFPGASGQEQAEKLWVGSVKTVIGHTEGTAGLAGLIKASLCLQHGEIVPNIHLNTLNPKVEPFFDHLRIATAVQPWPQLLPGVPRRASVNSFGFGGTNAHAILESYQPPLAARVNGCTSVRDADMPPLPLPFVFTAASDQSLGSTLERWHNYLVSPNCDMDHIGLAELLVSRRDHFTHKVVLQGSSTQDIVSEIEAELKRRKEKKASTIIRRPAGTGKKRVLGIFSGQGAQWPRMGIELVAASPAARMWVEEMQASLDELAPCYRPQYSLLAELSAAPDVSRVGQASISQPLCTALQVVLVNHLRAMGVEFSAVVGHSSGEIAAAYAAGFLSAADAIRIAHLRGLFAKLASGPGAMLAVGLSVEEAKAFCDQEQFLGRITVAAFNSPESATLSGNKDAIEEAAELLVAQSKFARALRVDTAYHSHHMAPCGNSYIRALGQSVVGSAGDPFTAWFSSVHGGQRIEGASLEFLKDVYWNDNMQKPVLFAQAMATALTESDPFDLLIELGPHPTLKGPVMQTISSIPGNNNNNNNNNAEIPYTALLKRGSSGLDTFASALGSLLTVLGPDSCCLSSYTRPFGAHGDVSAPLKTVPTYAFDHTQAYWAEPRVSQTLSQRHRPNLLLGTQLLHVACDGEWRWRNFLRREEIEWLDGHQIEQQTVFPATGYVAMALEAARVIAGDASLRGIEICEFHIAQAISLDADDPAGVETVFKVDRISGDKTNKMSLSFSCHAAFGAALRRCAYGNMDIVFGAAEPALLPGRELDTKLQGLSPVNIDTFYEHLGELGYGYTGLFRGVTTLERKHSTASGHMVNAARLEPTASPPLMMHPATMDTLLQTVLGAIGAPHDGRLSTICVPTKIGRIVINPLFGGATGMGRTVTFEARLTNYSPGNIQGDAALFDGSGHCAIQMEGVRVSPLAAPSPSDDRLLFSETAWGPLVPDMDISPSYEARAPEARRISELKEKVVLLYMCRIRQTLAPEHVDALNWHGKKIVDWFDHVLDLTRNGKHPVCKSEWLQESLDTAVAELGTSTIDMEAVRRVGDNLVLALRGGQTQTSMLGVLREHGLLDRLSTEFPELTLPREQLVRVAGQLAFRYPHMTVLEVGAGAGATTGAILEGLGRSYYSYTYTDTHSGYFEAAQSRFSGHSDRIIYKTLDVQKDLARQGFKESSYDLVVASNTLHAAESLQETLTPVRKLLKPGGYLLLSEGTNPSALLGNFIYCGFEGHWVGEQDGRIWTPMITAQAWDRLLVDTGFSGTDAVSPDHETELQSLSVILSQAVDSTINFLRQPLPRGVDGTTNDQHVQPRGARLIIIPTGSPNSHALVSELKTFLAPYFSDTVTATTLETLELHDSSTSGMAAITTLSLADVDGSCFREITDAGFETLKRLTEVSSRFLWVAAGRESENPYNGMAKGLMASVAYENPHALYQYFNIVDDEALRADVIACQLLRLEMGDADNDFRLPVRVWSTEVELRLEHGRLWIPRVRNDEAMNLRYMSNRRVVEEQVDCHAGSHHAVAMTESGRLVRSLGTTAPTHGGCGASGGATMRTVRTRYSLSHPLRLEGGELLYPVIGTCEQSKSLVLALAETRSSVITTCASWCWPVPTHIREEEEAAAYLYQTATHILAAHLVGMATHSSTIIVHEADDALRAAIVACAAAPVLRAVTVLFLDVYEKTPSKTHGCDQRWSSAEVVSVHQMTSTRALAKLFPLKNVSVVARFGCDPETTGVWSRLETILPHHVRRATIDGLLAAPVSVYSKLCRDTHSESGIASLEAARSRLAKNASSVAVKGIPDAVMVDVQSFAGSDDRALTVIDWTRTERVSVKIQPASSLVNLSPNKTYLLVGMTGDLGRSVCRWMIGRGARHVVVTSRNPKIENWWFEEMASLDAQVVAMSMDVTDPDSILTVDRVIRKDFPPVGGVVNGAMILLDKLFSSMSLDEWLRTTRPKVEGSMVLNELYTDSKDLDFFILMGSITGPLGNSSQSAYSAANNFMASIIRWRRERRLVGSIISPGQILGVGYVANADTWLLKHLHDTIGCYHVSEQDLHELFAEAILCGRPESGRNPDIIAGFRRASPATAKDIIWYRNTKMWPFVQHSLDEDSSASGAAAAGGGGARVSIKEQLAEAASLDEAVNLVEAGFTAKLRSKLQLAEDVQIVKEAAPAELGIDSLVAVDLRSWFVKEVGADVPVLKILGGMTLGQLVVEAAGKGWQRGANGVVNGVNGH